MSGLRRYETSPHVSNAQIAAIPNDEGRLEIGSELRQLSRVAPVNGRAVPDHSCAMVDGTREDAPWRKRGRSPRSWSPMLSATAGSRARTKIELWRDCALCAAI